jgi:hypothetical protein
MVYARGYERTCLDCGYSWQVSRAQAHLRSNGRFGRLLRRWFSEGAHVTALDDLHSGPQSDQTGSGALEAFCTCARCGSGRYSQTPLAVYEEPQD